MTQRLDPAVQEAASREWALGEDIHVSIGAGGLQRDLRWDGERFRPAFSRLTAHYWSQRRLLPRRSAVPP